MARRGLLTFQPTAADLWLARRMAHVACPQAERPAKVITWAADEKLLIAVVGIAWIGIRLLDDDTRGRRRADHLMLTTAVSTALPHLLKRGVERERPDRRVVGWPRHGVPHSGKPYDSFPSWHAVPLGAIAAALVRWMPKPWRSWIWPVAAGLAGTRLVLLAHWLTDVAAGLAIGVGLEAALWRCINPTEAGKPMRLRRC
jgi:membrane-associated phospholipid phosphatase